MKKQEKYKLVEARLLPSEFYWGFAMTLSCLFLIMYYIKNEISSIFAAVIVFIGGMLINHHKKIRERFDYEKVKIK